MSNTREGLSRIFVRFLGQKTTWTCEENEEVIWGEFIFLCIEMEKLIGCLGGDTQNVDVDR